MAHTSYVRRRNQLVLRTSPSSGAHTSTDAAKPAIPLDAPEHDRTISHYSASTSQSSSFVGRQHRRNTWCRTSAPANLPVHRHFSCEPILPQNGHGHLDTAAQHRTNIANKPGQSACRSTALRRDDVVRMHTAAIPLNQGTLTQALSSVVKPARNSLYTSGGRGLSLQRVSTGQSATAKPGNSTVSAGFPAVARASARPTTAHVPSAVLLNKLSQAPLRAPGGGPRQAMSAPAKVTSLTYKRTAEPAAKAGHPAHTASRHLVASAPRFQYRLQSHGSHAPHAARQRYLLAYRPRHPTAVGAPRLAAPVRNRKPPRKLVWRANADSAPAVNPRGPATASGTTRTGADAVGPRHAVGRGCKQAGAPGRPLNRPRVWHRVQAPTPAAVVRAAAPGSRTLLKRPATKLVRVGDRLYRCSGRGRVLVGRVTKPVLSSAKGTGATPASTTPGRRLLARLLATPTPQKARGAASKRSLTAQLAQRSLHRARAVSIRGRTLQPCRTFLRTGVCDKRQQGQCCLEHDARKVAVCTRWLHGKCQDAQCKLQHAKRPELMPVCMFFLQGKCSQEDCPYLHVNLDPCAPVCPDFANGWCRAGVTCNKKHLSARQLQHLKEQKKLLLAPGSKRSGTTRLEGITKVLKRSRLTTTPST